LKLQLIFETYFFVFSPEILIEFLFVPDTFDLLLCENFRCIHHPISTLFIITVNCFSV